MGSNPVADMIITYVHDMSRTWHDNNIQWLSMPEHTQPRSAVSDATFPRWISKCKKSKIWSSPSRDTDNERILQSDWTRVFWHITCEREFSQYGWGLLMKAINCKAFHFRFLPAITNATFYENSRKLYFGSL